MNKLHMAVRLLRL